MTASSGPGIALKGEAMGLGMILELPMIVINVQRGGPSTGLPTKTEQSDLLQGDVWPQRRIAACRSSHRVRPATAFDVAIEAWRIATECMMPGDRALGWLHRQRQRTVGDSRDANRCHRSRSSIPAGTDGDEPFMPYARDEYLARPWAIPGTPGLMHRVGGLEKEDVTGNVSYDPDNHQHMTDTRAAKVAKIAERIPEQEVFGEASGDVLVVSWGGTYGACHTAVQRCQRCGPQSQPRTSSLPESVARQHRRNARVVPQRSWFPN